MNIKEARKHIGKEVVLDESTKPYKTISGDELNIDVIKSFIGAEAKIANINHDGSVEVDFIYSDDSVNYWRISPYHLKLKQPNYKIHVTPETSAEVQELLFELGCGWSDNSNLPKYINFSFLYTENGLIKATNDYGIFIDNPAKCITLPELRKLVVDSKNEYGFETEIERHEVEEMTWQDALRAVADGKEVEFYNDFSEKWECIKGSCLYFIIDDNLKYRIKPQSITLEARAYTKEELLKIVEDME